MKPYLKIILLVSLIGIGAWLYWWLTRSKPTTIRLIDNPSSPGVNLPAIGNPWAVSDLVQVHQITALASQLQDKIGRDEVLDIFSAINQSGNGSGGGPDLNVPITQHGQTHFTISAYETRTKASLNGLPLEPDEFTLAPPNFTYTGLPVLEMDDTLTLSF